MSLNEPPLPFVQAPYGPSGAEVFAEVVQLRLQARQQLQRLMATMAQLEDFLEAMARQQHDCGTDREAKST